MEEEVRKRRERIEALRAGKQLEEVSQESQGSRKDSDETYGKSPEPLKMDELYNTLHS